MLSQDLVDQELVGFYLDLKPNEEVDLEVAALAAIEWAKALKAAARSIDDSKSYRVNLIAAEPGSKRWLAKIEESSVNEATKSTKERWDNIPLILRLALASIVVIPMTAKPTYDFWLGEDGVSEVVGEQIQIIVDKVWDDTEVKKHKKSMYRQCQRDSSIIGLGGGVPDKEQWRPRDIIPASRFPEGEGLFDLQEEEPQKKPIYQTLDVVLVSPNLDNPRLTWEFRQEGISGTIRAAMRDDKFLNALDNSTLKEKLRSQIRMKIKLEIIEVFDGEQWKVKHGGRTVIEVISPKTY